MTRTTAHVTISLDGFIAGPDQGLDNPMGVGGPAMHRWQFAPANAADEAARADLRRQRGAYVMGRNMFAPGRGEWDLEWTGWWEDEPPYHAPVFVLTHHPREPLELVGTTFHFVTDGFDAAYERAREAAGEADVGIAGGASVLRQALAAGVVDELTLDVAPALLGAGERPLDGLPPALELEPTAATHSPLATHVTYAVRAPE